MLTTLYYGEKLAKYVDVEEDDDNYYDDDDDDDVAYILIGLIYTL